MSRFLDPIPLVKVALNGVIFCLSVYLFLMIGPWIETRIWPVISEFVIVKAEPVDPSRTRLMVSFNKRRDCNYVGIAWFRGVQSRSFERVRILLFRQDDDRGSPNRPTGRQRAGPWIIDVPIDEVRDNSFAEIHHECHRLWQTRTHLFP